MARNLKYELGSTYSLSETGWAGPTGSDGKTEKGVGSVYFAIVGPTGQKTVSKNLQGLFKDGGFDYSNRAENMATFAKLALEFLLEYLTQESEKTK